MLLLLFIPLLFSPKVLTTVHIFISYTPACKLMNIKPQARSHQYHSFLADFLSVSKTGKGTFQVSCPNGTSVLYCGNRNTQLISQEVFRSAKPISATACQCYDYFGEECVAWCTAAPLKDIEIPITVSKQTFKATCSNGRQVLGCYLYPRQGQPHEPWPAFYPSDSESCTCYHRSEAECIAMCASNIANYEVNVVAGNGVVRASCVQPGNSILGCGSDADEATKLASEKFPSVHVTGPNSCECFNRVHVKCYAICGQFSSTTSSVQPSMATTTSSTTTGPSKYVCKVIRKGNKIPLALTIQMSCLNKFYYPAAAL